VTEDLRNHGCGIICWWNFNSETQLLDSLNN